MSCYAEIAFILPCADSEAMQRVPIDWNSSFEEVVERVHEALQCTNIAKKPILLYKLPSAKQKQNPFSLSTAEDWEGCRDAIMDEVAKKKRNDMGTIQVSIELGPENVSQIFVSRSFALTPFPVFRVTPYACYKKGTRKSAGRFKGSIKKQEEETCSPSRSG